MLEEIEFKFRVNPRKIAALKKSLALTGKVSQHGQAEAIKNQYVDTKTGAICAKKYALRIRRCRGQYFQTLKGSGQGKGGLHRRREWEYALLKLKHKPFQGDLSLFPQKIQRWLNPLELQVIFTTDFRRETWLLALPHRTLVEVALDQGWVKAKKKKERICELELELKKGSIQSLKDFARKLQKIGHLIPENASKAARGYRLYEQ